MSIVIGFVLDLIFGDPYHFPHPVRLMGLAIERGEKRLRGVCGQTRKGEFVGGMLLSVGVVLLCFIVPFCILYALGKINVYLRMVVEAFFCYQILAVKSLRTESMKVYDPLVKNDLPAARQMLSRIVGRDTAELDAEQIAKAAVETVAENTSDGVIAPLLFMAIGGAPLGFLYKGINTLDSMLGYKNEKYLFFGKFAARLDDVANFVPARVSAWLMLFAGFLLKMDVGRGYLIFVRDRHQHASPNSAQTEAVCAGLLGVQLAGDAVYFGKMVKKPTIGDPERPVIPEDLRLANRLMVGTAFCGLLMAVVLRWLLWRGALR